MEIVALTEDTVEQAITLVQTIFATENKDDIALAFNAALGRGKEEALKKWKVRTIKYWVVIEDSQVIGTVGMYEHVGDLDSFWGGWMCVDPRYRRKGIGSKLLEFGIDLAKKAGKKYIRLYTSTDPNEAAAQILYDKRGFKEYKREPEPNTKYERIYKQLEL